MRRLKIIEGYEDYKVSDDGIVYSYKNGKEHILSQRKNQGGYMYVNLCKNGKYKSKSVHKLVSSLYVDNPNNYKVVNHIDGYKLNNHYTNLEFTTYRGNAIHAIEK